MKQARVRAAAARVAAGLWAVCAFAWWAVPAAAQTLAAPVALDAPARAELASRYATALQTELGLLQALDQIDQNAAALDAKIVRLSVQRAEAVESLQAAEAERAAAEATLRQMREAVQARLRAVLRVAQLPTLRFALSPEDFAQSIAKDRLLRQLLAKDKERLQAYRAQLTELQARTRTRDAEVQRLTELDLALHEEKAKGDQERRDKEALLRQIESDRKYHERAVRDLDAAHRALTEQIGALREWNEKKYTFGLLQGKLLPPVQGRIEVHFGDQKHPRYGTILQHRGVDFRPGGGPGVPVRAVFTGQVAYAGWLTGYGETVILDHGRGWHSVYAHLENVRVTVGEVVKSRARVADVGQSGSLKGRYLYFEIRRNGIPVNPEEWVR